MASPLCQVKFGAGAYASTTNGINATAGSVVVINLISSIGAPTWAIACVYADDLSTVASVNASLTIDPVGRTATFTAPVAGRGYIFQSVINAGNNLATNQPDPTTATTFGIWVPTASGARVLIPNETFESSATSGWVADVNFPIRNPSTGGGTVPTGTGIPHIVGGAQNAAASLIVDADVSAVGAGKLTGTVAVANGGTGLAAAGTTGTFLTIVAGAPAYGNAASSFGVGTGVVAGVGGLRVDTTAQQVIAGRNTSNTGDVEYVSINGSNQLFIGTDTGFTAAKQAGAINMYVSSGGTIAIGRGSSTMLYSSGYSFEFWRPIGGSVPAAVAFQWTTSTVTVAAGSNTLTAAQYSCPVMTLQGAAGAFSVVAPLQQGSAFDVYNATGSLGTFGGVTGATVSIPAGTKARCVCFDGANYR